MSEREISAQPAQTKNGPAPDESDAGIWNSRAPTLPEFEALAAEEFSRLPAPFRALCADLVVRVDDYPDADTLHHFGLGDPFDLLGLFQGVGLPFQSLNDVAPMPNMIWLYRRPILDYWAAHDDALGAIVRHVLIHEIGHHFGFSDDDMEQIEAGSEEAG